MLSEAAIFSTLFTTCSGMSSSSSSSSVSPSRSFCSVTNSSCGIGIHPVWFDIIISNLSNACCGDYNFLVIFFLFLLSFHFPVFHLISFWCQSRSRSVLFLYFRLSSFVNAFHFFPII